MFIIFFIMITNKIPSAKPNSFNRFFCLLLILLIGNNYSYSADYFSYQSGDWADPLNWTTDPSGATLVGSAVPGATDNVTVLNGRSIFTLVNRTVA